MNKEILFAARRPVLAGFRDGAPEQVLTEAGMRSHFIFIRASLLLELDLVIQGPIARAVDRETPARYGQCFASPAAVVVQDVHDGNAPLGKAKARRILVIRSALMGKVRSGRMLSLLSEACTTSSLGRKRLLQPICAAPLFQP